MNDQDEHPIVALANLIYRVRMIAYVLTGTNKFWNKGEPPPNFKPMEHYLVKKEFESARQRLQTLEMTYDEWYKRKLKR